jgi:hypothetical protein
MPERNFPPPWSVEELDSCFVVKDANGQALAYMYFEKEPRRRFLAALRLPAIYQWPESAEEGGFASYGPRFDQILETLLLDSSFNSCAAPRSPTSQSSSRPSSSS